MIEGKSFKNIDFKEQGLASEKYVECSFDSCQFGGMKIMDKIFQECEFKHCDLSLCNVGNTAFKDVSFLACKLVGIDFSKCNDFLLDLKFEDCIMRHASFYGLKKGISKFLKCNLQEVEFTEADLSGLSFDGCDLSAATFQHTILTKANLREAIGYQLDPSQNQVKGMKVSRGEVEGLLSSFGVLVK